MSPRPPARLLALFVLATATAVSLAAPDALITIRGAPTDEDNPVTLPDEKPAPPAASRRPSDPRPPAHVAADPDPEPPRPRPAPSKPDPEPSRSRPAPEPPKSRRWATRADEATAWGPSFVE